MQLSIVGGAPTMSSLELVDFINSQRQEHEPELRHDHFMDKVPKVLGRSDAPKFLGTQRYGNNNTRNVYYLPKREACLMAMSYSYELQAKVFDRMTALEAAQSPPAHKIPQTLSEALMLGAKLAQQVEEQAAALAIAGPKVEIVDRYMDATGTQTFRQVAKLLEAKEPAFRAFLAARRIMYQIGGEWVPYAEHLDAGRFVVKTGSADNGHAFSTSRFTPKGVAWVSGLWLESSGRKA
jgi:phage antirepressor YoqD-like protein